MISKHVIPIDPVGKPRMTRSDRWKERPVTTRYWQFKDALKLAYPHQLPPRFAITFHIPMPKSWSNKKKESMFGQPHQQRPDIDNILKSVMDSLCEDDSYIYDIRMTKKWAVLGSIELIIETQYNDIDKE